METKVYKEVIQKMKTDLKQIGVDIRVKKMALKEKQRGGHSVGFDITVVNSMSYDARCRLNAYCMVRSVPYKSVEGKVRDGNQLWSPDVHKFIKIYFDDEVSQDDVEKWLIQ